MRGNNQDRARTPSSFPRARRASSSLRRECVGETEAECDPDTRNRLRPAVRKEKAPAGCRQGGPVSRQPRPAARPPVPHPSAVGSASGCSLCLAEMWLLSQVTEGTFWLREKGLQGFLGAALERSRFYFCLFRGDQERQRRVGDLQAPRCRLRGGGKGSWAGTRGFHVGETHCGCKGRGTTRRKAAPLRNLPPALRHRHRCGDSSPTLLLAAPHEVLTSWACHLESLFNTT